MLMRLLTTTEFPIGHEPNPVELKAVADAARSAEHARVERLLADKRADRARLCDARNAAWSAAKARRPAQEIMRVPAEVAAHDKEIAAVEREIVDLRRRLAPMREAHAAAAKEALAALCRERLVRAAELVAELRPLLATLDAAAEAARAVSNELPRAPLAGYLDQVEARLR